MKIAIIGFGYWGEKLVKTLLSFKEINSIYVVDSDKKKKTKAENYYLKFSKNLTSVLPKVDVVIIATWENTHYSLVKKCLLANKHVLVEKPLAIHYGEAEELVALAKKNHLTLMVDNTFLFDESFFLIKNKIKKAESGKLLKIDSFRFSPNISKPFTNVIVDLLPHDLSIFCFLLNGQPKKINIKTNKLTQDNLDNAQVNLDFDSVKTTSFLSWTYPLNRREMVFYLTKEVILWKKKGADEDIITYFKYYKQNKLQIKEELVVTNKEQTLKTMLQEFLQSVLNKKVPKTAGEIVLPEIKILENVLKKCPK